MTSNSPNLAALQGQDVYDPQGDKVGTVGQIFADQAGQPAWASVNTGLLGMHHTLVPLNGATTRDDGLQIAFDKATVKAAPNVDYSADEPLTGDQVQELYQHYQLQWDATSTEDYERGYSAGAEQTRDSYDTSTSQGAYERPAPEGGFDRPASEGGYERPASQGGYERPDLGRDEDGVNFSTEQTRVDRAAPSEEERHRLI
ncbi:PRC-barrel domain-containing protein [Dactylosporangium sp. NPDC051541]|uniref:PRC-barrel domain-containing protein n=1 Tax=Dactylosporangium sp. NPDC051541 TaxID=3363977 RepID=UPI00379D2D10